MNGAIESLFCSNPDLSHQIYTYCKTNPEFMEAEAEYDALLQSLEQTLGYARMQEIEDCFLRYSARLVQAYYLFGLGLRQSRGSLGAGAGMIGWGVTAGFLRSGRVRAPAPTAFYIS